MASQYGATNPDSQCRGLRCESVKNCGAEPHTKGVGCMSKVRFLGLDVHGHTISVAVAEPGGEVRSLGTIRNSPGEIRKLIKRLQPVSTLRACYEAGPTGYVLY